MRLGQLLGDLSAEQLDQLCLHLVPGAENVPQHQRAASVESVLRDSGFIESSLFQHRPPVLAMLRELLEARGHRAPVAALRIGVLETTEIWCARVAEGELAARRDNFRIYRKLLAGAWANDLRLDASELTLLGILRRELGMTAVEHFLISHHPEIQTFWRSDDCFEVALDHLLKSGIVFRSGEEVLIPEEFVHRVQRALGLQISRGAAIRLLDFMSNEDLRTALERHETKKSGDKSERIARIVDEMIPMSEVLEAASIQELQAIARETGASISGAKDELVYRLIEHFEDGRDLAKDEPSPGVTALQPKLLRESAFQRLFQHLTGHQLELLCRRHDLRHTGTKEQRVMSLWSSSFDERTLLKALRNSDLSSLCKDSGLDSSGAKDAMIERLIVSAVGTH